MQSYIFSRFDIHTFPNVFAGFLFASLKLGTLQAENFRCTAAVLFIFDIKLRHIYFAVSPRYHLNQHCYQTNLLNKMCGKGFKFLAPWLGL